MSSHHIVREKQEPALLVLGMDNFDNEQLGQLLEWSPTVITTPVTAEKLNTQGIKIDWIITDEAESALQSDIKNLPADTRTVIAAAMDHLIAEGYPAVNIVTDEFKLAEYLPFTDKINLVIFYHQQKIYAVPSGFNKWKPGGEEIRILSKAGQLKTIGLEKQGDNDFKTSADGFFSLSFDEDFLFISEKL